MHHHAQFHFDGITDKNGECYQKPVIRFLIAAVVAVRLSLCVSVYMYMLGHVPSSVFWQ